MLPFDPKKIQGMLKQFGMKQEQIDAEEVIIKCRDKKIIITQPNVTKVNFQGKETFQIIGDVEETGAEEAEIEISEDDINTVAKQAKVSRGKAKEALEKADGDLAKAVLELKNQ